MFGIAHTRTVPCCTAHPIVGDPLYGAETTVIPSLCSVDTIERVPDQYYDSLCRECCNPLPQTGVLAMCLHAASYTSEQWSFTAQPPTWASELLATSQTVDVDVAVAAAAAAATTARSDSPPTTTM
jgi:hypothetical protein